MKKLIKLLVIAILIFFGYKGISQNYGKGLPEGLKKSVTAWIEQIKKPTVSNPILDELGLWKDEYGNKHGYREFRISCTREDSLDPADALNGVTEKWFVGIEFVYFNSIHNKFYENGRVAYFVNTKSGWKMERDYDSFGANTKECYE